MGAKAASVLRSFRDAVAYADAWRQQTREQGNEGGR